MGSYKPHDAVHGNIGLSRWLDKNLRTVIQNTDDPTLKHLMSEVLNRRASLRDIGTSEHVLAAAGDAVKSVARQLNELSDDDRQRMVDDGEAQFCRLADESAD